MYTHTRCSGFVAGYIVNVYMYMFTQTVFYIDIYIDYMYIAVGSWRDELMRAQDQVRLALSESDHLALQVCLCVCVCACV